MACRLGKVSNQNNMLLCSQRPCPPVALTAMLSEQALQEVWHAAALLNDLAEGSRGTEALAAGLQAAALQEQAEAQADGAVPPGEAGWVAETSPPGRQSKRKGKQRKADMQASRGGADGASAPGKRSWLSRMCCVRRRRHVGE